MKLSMIPFPGGSRRRSEDKEDRLGIERLLRSADTDSESEDEEDYEPADYWRKTISGRQRLSL